MRVFTIINGYTGALCLQELLDQGHEVVGVVTAPNFQPNVPSEQTVIGVAIKNLLPLYMPTYETVAEPAPKFLELFRNAKPDLMVSMHYPAIFKQVLLDIPPLGCVNIHPSKVPEGRGMTPSWWYLYLGRKTAWTALHYLDAGVDSGDVIAFGSTTITDEDTGATVSKRLSEAAFQIFRDNLPAIMAGTAPRQKQDLSKGSYLWSGRNWHLINWSRGARGIRGQIRCFTDTANNAYTFIGGRKLTINDAQIFDQTFSKSLVKRSTKEDKNFKEAAVPGEVLAITGKGPLVQTGRGMLILTDFAIEGEKTDSLGALMEGGMPVVLG
jgi:methionyl-tRNA formyltransferase